MNVTGETKEIPLFSIIQLEELYKENHLGDVSLTDFYIDRNKKVYLLLEKPLEQERKDIDWFLTASDYAVVELKLDWTEKRVLETTLFPLGALAFQFHYLRPVGDDFLLLGARCAYRKKGPDKNAWLVRRDGTVLSRFCLGDGIEECIVRSDSTIITSYFDEGVFGNNGWGCTYHDEYVPPVGECGLIVWTAEGVPIWKNERYTIDDCYAISMDEQERLWFYYYSEFQLVRTDFKEDLVLSLPFGGSRAFAVAPSGKEFLFQGGYRKREQYFFLNCQDETQEQEQRVTFTVQGKEVAVERCSLLCRQMLFLGADGVVYGGMLD